MAERPPTLQTPLAIETEDAGRRAFDFTLSVGQLATAFTEHRIYVIPEEQRGIDPVGGTREILNEKKVADWAQRELDGHLHMGQVTLCAHLENGTSYQYDTDNVLQIYGPCTIADGRQRVYAASRAFERWNAGKAPKYNPERRVSVRLYIDLDSEGRKELFNQMNGGRGGDHADQSRVKWLAPENTAIIAKKLVTSNAHLGTENVNVVQNRISRRDHRLAGFNTFDNAIQAAWDKPLTTEEANHIGDYLNNFWNALVEVLPQLGVMPLEDRQALRERSLIGNPLAIYGFMAVAKRLYDMDPSNPPLDRLGVLGDPSWFDIDRDFWKEVGVLQPTFDRKTHEIKRWSARNSFQTRKAFADAMVDRMFPADAAAA